MLRIRINSNTFTLTLFLIKFHKLFCLRWPNILVCWLITIYSNRYWRARVIIIREKKIAKKRLQCALFKQKNDSTDIQDCNYLQNLINRCVCFIYLLNSMKSFNLNFGFFFRIFCLFKQFSKKCWVFRFQYCEIIYN